MTPLLGRRRRQRNQRAEPLRSAFGDAQVHINPLNHDASIEQNRRSRAPEAGGAAAAPL